MKKLICFTTYPPEAPSVYHRMEAYRPYLRQQGIELEIISFMTSGLFKKRRLFGVRHTLYKIALMLFCSLRLLFNLPRAARADTVIIHREVFPLGKPWCERAIARISRRCFYDIDDAIWFPPSNAVNQRSAFWDAQRIPNIMASVDGVIAGSPYIEEYAAQFNANIVNIPTSYDDLLGQSDSDNRCPVIVWIGNWGNASYLEQILPALETLPRRHTFILRLIGGQDIHQICSETVTIEYVDWSRSAESTLLAQSDIGIMPLVDQNYEKGKCAFKLIQYMSAGLPVIASPVGMNNCVVSDDVGRLAETPEEWLAAFDTLLTDGSLRAGMGKAAYQKYQSNFSRNINAARLAALV